MSDRVNEVFQKATKCRENAYAPYSNYKVGSGLITDASSEIFVGCNVENSSFGATICAERNAILNWVANTGGGTIQDIVIVTHNGAVPCGMCLQVIQEFSDENTQIHLATPEKIISSSKFSDFLPRTYTKEDLK